MPTAMELPLRPCLNTVAGPPQTTKKPECRTRLPSLLPHRSSLLASAHASSVRSLRCMSVDVKSDASSQSQSAETSDADIQPSSRRAEEKFAVLNTGKWECRSCGFIYDQYVGDPSYPVAPGTEFSQLPEDWRCATCGAGKSYFNSKSVEVAGFAENQKFGFGTNSLTSGQKSILIYGSLFFFFLLFLSGYFIQ